MDRKERALELARQQYADGGGPRHTSSHTEHGEVTEPSKPDRTNVIRNALDKAQEVCSTVVGGIKAAPSSAKNFAINTARYIYNNPSNAAGDALEFVAGMSPHPVAMILWGPNGILSPSSAKAPELDPEIAMRHAQAQEAQLMRDENYAGGYAEGGEVHERYSQAFPENSTLDDFYLNYLPEFYADDGAVAKRAIMLALKRLDAAQAPDWQHGGRPVTS